MHDKKQRHEGAMHMRLGVCIWEGHASMQAGGNTAHAVQQAWQCTMLC